MGDIQSLKLESGLSSLSCRRPLGAAARGKSDQQVLLERESASTTGTEPGMPAAVTLYNKSGVEVSFHLDTLAGSFLGPNVSYKT